MKCVKDMPDNTRYDAKGKHTTQPVVPEGQAEGLLVPFRQWPCTDAGRSRNWGGRKKPECVVEQEQSPCLRSVLYSSLGRRSHVQIGRLQVRGGECIR